MFMWLLPTRLCGWAITLWLCVAAFTSQAQAPQKQWDRTLGGSDYEALGGLTPTPDGGYLLAGWSTSGASGVKSQGSRGGYDFWVVKVDALGRPQWDRTYGGSRDEQLTCVRLTRDGGYLLGGYSESGISGDKSQANHGVFSNDMWVIKLDAQGNKEWDRSLGGSGDEQLYSMVQTPDGGYVLGGTSASGQDGNRTQPSQGNYDYWLVKLDGQGRTQWDRTYGGQLWDRIYSVELTADGGLLASGVSGSGISGDKTQTHLGNEFWILKLDAQGRKQWDRSLGGDGDDVLTCAKPTPDGGYILGGWSDSNVSGDKTQPHYGNNSGYNHDYWVVKLNAQGAVQWERTLGGDAIEQLYALELTADGGYLVGGRSTSNVSGDKTQPNRGNTSGYSWDYWLVKLSATGTTEWDHTLGGDKEDYLAGIVPGVDGGYLIGGFSSSAVSGDKSEPSTGGDFWLVKLAEAALPPSVQISGIQELCGGKIELTATATATPVAYLGNTGATTRSIEVTARFSGGQTSTAQHVVRAFTPTLRVEGDTLLCAGSTVQLLAVAPNASGWLWNTGATTATLTVTKPGQYSVIARYGAGCSITKQVTVRSPSLRLAGPAFLCDNSTSNTTLEALAPGATTFRWNTGATTATLSVSRAGTYSVVATFANGCTLTALQVVASPQVAIVGDTLLCESGTVTLRASGNPALSYRWNTGETNSTLPVTQSGTYTLTATYLGGCSSTASVRVRPVQPMPFFSFGPDTTLCEGATLALRAPVVPGRPVTYRWSDGSSASSLLVRAAGTYSLVVTTLCETRTFTRRITYRSCLLLPTIVTANSDGLNDYFAPQGLVGGTWSLTVYNRWGTQVYHTPHYQNEWGLTAATGAYYYLLHNPETGVRYKGAVQVVR
jgi:hypothetical protein